MKVYIVETGCYSDRYTSGVFSTRELAEANIALHGPNDSWSRAGDITEYEVDEQASDVKKLLFTAEIDVETGEIFRENQHDWFCKPEERSREPKLADFRPHGKSMIAPSFGRLCAEVGSFVSREHARKLAAEYRQNYLREAAITA